ncbi:ROK family protein [Propionibacterium australiense]|uniref:ROK family n=1 Tax=Propionibacterium australiense TaxID=119981 RepID=A0A383S4P5_9ACTN|nr:ROK family protein [Propionibacterium australiense]SYZ32988.1 ROK family [Propionibacterium australiense]VEH92293.1 Fructokinase [Propionibacterium australiense]
MVQRHGAADRLRWALAADACALVRSMPGITRAGLAHELGISSGTAADLVTRMRRAALLDEGESVVHGRGRPTSVLTAHPRGPLVVAVEITTTGWRVAAAGLDGRLTVLAEAPHRDRRPAGMLAPIRRAVAAATREHAGRVRAVSVAAAATIRDGAIVQSSVLGWEQVRLTSLAMPGAAMLITNDATSEALAESRRGASRGARHALHLTVLTGVGGGLVLDGSPMLGATGLAMEIGHLPFGDPEAICDCGARGCWDTALGAGPLSRRLGTAPDSVPAIEAVIARGDPAHDGVLEAAATSLGRGLAGLVNTMDPDVVTLGGIGPLLRTRSPLAFEQALAGGLMRCLREAPPRILAGELGADAALIGAAESALDEVASPAGLAAWSAPDGANHRRDPS